MYDNERRVAIDAVTAAAKLCRNVQATLIAGGTLAKGDKSPVTVADFGAQAVVSHLLERAFPADPLIGEEAADSLRKAENRALHDKVVAAAQSVVPLSAEQVLAAIDRGIDPGGARGRRWTLDPVDGTKGFLRQEQYAVALALLVDGDPVVGVLGCPALPVDDRDPTKGLGVLFVATRGGGTTMRPLDGGEERRIHVDEVADPALARFCESVEKEHSSQDHAAQIAAKLGITQPPYRIDSQCKYGAVARGDASIYLRLPTRADYVENIWDHAAGYRVIVEAGGAVSDVTGRPLDFSLGRGLSANKGVVVTNGRLHDRVIAAVREVLGV